MRLTTVSIDGLVRIPAYVNDDVHWNGWECPWFRAEDVHLIQDTLDLIGEGETIRYVEDEDAYAIKISYEDDVEDWYWGDDVDGMHLYPIGAGIWIWQEDE